MDLKGTIVFTTIGRPQYGFDVFSVKIPSNLDIPAPKWDSEHCLTDGISINFNGQFVDEDETLVYVSERTGSSRIFLTRRGETKSEKLPSPPESLFHDRPIISNGRLYFISAHEPADKLFKSWSALYSTGIHGGEVARLTPYGFVDYSPAVSRSGKIIAVASYGSSSWGGEFHELMTDIVVFSESDPNKRTVICHHGGWPTWSGDSTVYFHRQADDGWWSIFRIDLPEDFELSDVPPTSPRRVTPPGIHSFTPAAMHDGERIVVATRRRETKFRHIEIFDVKSQKFHPVTELINPDFHHYNPFVSPESGFIGYHRFRGETESGDSIIPHLEFVTSPIKELQMFRLNGSFPSFSPNRDLIALNPDFTANSGLKIVKSDGSMGWDLFKGRVTFCNSWCPTEKNVIFTSVGPIFASPKSTVQIARVSFDLEKLDNHCENIPVDIKILTSEESGNNAFPACSPDGKSVVFRSGRSGYKNLYIMDAVNGEIDGEIRQLTNGPWIDTMPSWSPDGKLVAFSSNRHNPENAEAFSIYVIDSDGRGVRRIHVAGTEGSSEVNMERINHVCFSADGEWLLFTANFGGVTAEPVSVPNQFQPYGDLYVVRIDGSGLRRLTWNVYENGTPAWLPEAVPDMSRLRIGGEFGEKLKGQFDEPLWIRCDI
ncbi:hypothetical protein U1Q18_034344 [Sarracenia purpurea var. burkii]